ncbi:MAG: N-acetyltransferase [Rhodocyclaceae bacterium]|nr:N-acetyltransferase [Rhodocyclaceae bacterium]
MTDVFVHDTAIVSPQASIGPGTKVWVNVQIREGARIGRNCIVSKDVYVDHHVSIGDNCKVQNGVSIYHGVTVGDDVFIGPNASFTNDRVPRAFNKDWKITPTTVGRGASIGANATIVCGVALGEFCMVAAGSVVTADVPPHGLVMGNPARLVDYVTVSGRRLHRGPGDPPGAEVLADATLEEEGRS